MSRWFLCFLVYSFLGCCLEKLFAHAVRSPERVRKCLLLLPLCPVYGLAMTACAALTGPSDSLLRLALVGGAVCTAAEYLVHLFYERAFAVRFWDYSRLPWHLRGRVCPQFALIWGVLSALSLRFIQPWVLSLTAAVPAGVSFALWLVFAADCVVSGALLLEEGDTQLLALGSGVAHIWASSHSRTS